MLFYLGKRGEHCLKKATVYEKQMRLRVLSTYSTSSGQALFHKRSTPSENPRECFDEAVMEETLT
jgi:hypothetical protein